MEYIAHIEWDEANLEHATRRATAVEIEQAIRNARMAVPSRVNPDRVKFESRTDGGRRLIVIAVRVGDRVRPVTAWEAKK